MVALIARHTSMSVTEPEMITSPVKDGPPIAI
jgi:hypothetical protein